jgi:hypothetical protein
MPRGPREPPGEEDNPPTSRAPKRGMRSRDRTARTAQRGKSDEFRFRVPMDLTEAERHEIARVAELPPQGDGLRLAAEVREAGRSYWTRRAREPLAGRLPDSERIKRLERMAGALERRMRYPWDTPLKAVEKLAGLGSLVRLGLVGPGEWERLDGGGMAAKLRQLAAWLPQLWDRPKDVPKGKRRGRPVDLILIGFVCALARAWREITRRPVVIRREPVPDSPEGEERTVSPFMRFAHAVLAIVDPPLAAKLTLHQEVQHLLSFDANGEIVTPVGEDSDFVHESDFFLSNDDLGLSKG